MKCEKTGLMYGDTAMKIVLGCYFSVAILGFGGVLKFEAKKSQLYEKVMEKADLNNDGEVDCLEWEKVYHLLDLKYDSCFYNPKEDLTYSSMKSYLNKK